MGLRINAVQENTASTISESEAFLTPVSLSALTMDIPIQHPWYRKAFPNRLTDLYLAEPLADWPFFWSLPRIRPSLLHWFNWLDDGHSEMHMEKDRYVIHLDVKHFSPDELSVSVSDDFITVHAKHEERLDNHGFVSREFLRKYRLPSGVLAADVTSTLSSDGMLTIMAPRSSPRLERNIPITFDDETQKQKQ